MRGHEPGGAAAAASGIRAPLRRTSEKAPLRQAGDHGLGADQRTEEFALILDCADETEAKEKLKTFLAKLQLFSNSAFVGMQAALSGATQGKACLAEALKQARDVLEFRHTRPHASILTACDVAFATAEHYDYPLATEKKLLDFVTQ